jgi:hypothetical protein
VRIGADAWLTDEGNFDDEDEYRAAQFRHQQQRVNEGISWYDMVNADDFIIGVIAKAARHFDEDGASHPGGMSEEDWSATLKTIYEPLEAYLMIDPMVDEDAARQIRVDAQDALHAFADYFQAFWD